MCPAPIGRVVLDDCERWRHRYESVVVELRADFGNHRATLVGGRTKLRDPAAVVEVVAHRLHTLCRDFNACRLAPQAYRAERDALDAALAEIVALHGALRDTTDEAARAALERELARQLDRLGGLGEPAPVARRRLSGSQPWFGTSRLPPQPPAHDGFPRLGPLED